MSSRCLVFFCLFVAAQSALIKRNIPVEVVYDTSSPDYYGNRNLEEKIQLSQTDLLRLKLSDEILNEREEQIVDELRNKYHGEKNLETKVQLSTEELEQALKHLPNVVDDEELVKSEISENAEVPTTEPSSGNTVSLLRKAEELVHTGICALRKNIDNVAETIRVTKPSEEAWQKLNKTLQHIFDDQYKTLDVKQDQSTDNQNNQNNQFFQNLMSDIGNVISNFTQTYFPQNNQQTNRTEDEQQGQGETNPFQNFYNFINQGITQIFNNNASGQNSTSGQEDTGNQSNQNNIFNNIYETVQGFFSGQNQGGSTQKPVQGDEGTQTTTTQRGPIEIFQGFIGQISNAFNNNQQTTSKPPNAEDEGTGSSTQSSNFIENIGQAFQNINIFRPQTSTEAPQGGASGGAGGLGSNPILSGAQTIGSQIQQLAGGGGNEASTTSTEKSKIENLEKDEGVSSPLPESEKAQSTDKTETSEVTEKTE